MASLKEANEKALSLVNALAQHYGAIDEESGKGFDGEKDGLDILNAKTKKVEN